VCEEADVVRSDGAAIFVAEEIFEEDAEGEGQACEVDSWVGRGEGLKAKEADGGGAGSCRGAERELSSISPFFQWQHVLEWE
jgi:hypothetical protein